MKLTERYLELLKKSLVNEIYIENEVKLIYIIHCLSESKPISNRYLVYPENIPDEYFQAVRNAKAIGSVITLQTLGKV